MSTRRRAVWLVMASLILGGLRTAMMGAWHFRWGHELRVAIPVQTENVHNAVAVCTLPYGRGSDIGRMQLVERITYFAMLVGEKSG